MNGDQDYEQPIAELCRQMRMTCASIHAMCDAIEQTDQALAQALAELAADVPVMG